MARPVSSLESHPQRQRIINAILAGSSLRQIAAWAEPKVTESAICRWKQKAAATFRNTRAEIADAVTNSLAYNDANTPIAPNSEVIRAATQAALVAASDPFLLAAEKQAKRRSRWMDEIETAGDYSDNGPDYATLAKLDRNDQTGLELHARLAGRLDTGTHNTVNVAIVCPTQADAPEPQWEGITIDIGSK